MDEKMLEIKDLSVEYTTDEEVVKAVNRVSLSLGRGETIGLVGETGAGKTTLALTLMRLLPKVSGRVTGGQILFDGQDLLQLPEPEMRTIRGEKISMIFQDPMTSLNPVLTVGDQIGEALDLHMELTKEEKEQRIDEILRLVGIDENRKKDYPHQFSGGMRLNLLQFV